VWGRGGAARFRRARRVIAGAAICCAALAAAATSAAATPTSVSAEPTSLGASPAPTPQYLPITATATIAGQKIALEVAATPEQRRIGLTARPQLATKRGMLFVFDPPEPATFWMKNVNHPLDMLFIYESRVRKITPSAPPCKTEICPTYGRGADPVQYVLELRAGASKQLGIKKGNMVKIEFEDPA
jgi:uncharacterized membrane protein (UPF0127 family)